jgi:hypothetical protein
MLHLIARSGQRLIVLVALALLAVAASAPSHAQLPPGPEGVLQIGDDLTRFLERQQVLGNLPSSFLGAQPLSAHEARRYLDSLAIDPGRLTATDRARLARFRREAPGPGTEFVRSYVPFLYKDGETFFSVREDDYALHMEPLAYLSLGRANRHSPSLDERDWVAYWQNTRGARVAGHLGDHLFFEGRLEENQWHVPFNERRAESAPRLPFVRDLDGAYDYMLSTGMVGVHTKYVELRAGRDRAQWGFGASSVALSNYAPTFEQIQIRTQFWRIHYTNLFAQFVDRAPDHAGRRILPRKYGAYHRLAIDLPGDVQLEFFEMVLHGPDTTDARVRSGFEVSYLNPIIFYRAVEGDLGWPDNMLLGAGAAWNPVPGWRLYGQFILDEFQARSFFDDWWGNKWGYLVGTRVSDPGGLPNVDLQLEYARLRPYLYSHHSLASTAVHQDDILGHPIGPNAWDLTGIVNWQPTHRLATTVNVAYTARGRNPDGENWGADPRLPYTSRVEGRDRMTTTLQGIRQNILLVEARANYELLPGMFAEATVRAESVDDAERGRQAYVAPYVTLRWGLPFQSVRW